MEKDALVRRNAGPGPLIVLDDRQEPVTIPFGCWVSATRVIDSTQQSEGLERFGPPGPLPSGMTHVMTFTANGERHDVWEPPAPEPEPTPAVLPTKRFRKRKWITEDASPAAIVVVQHDDRVSDKHLEQLRLSVPRSVPIGACVSGDTRPSATPYRKHGGDLVPMASKADLAAVLNAAPRGVRWVVFPRRGEVPRAGSVLSAAELLDRRGAGAVKTDNALVATMEVCRDVTPAVEGIGVDDMVRAVAHCGHLVLGRGGKRIRVKGTRLSPRPKDPAVTVVIPVHNSLRATTQCFRSLVGADAGIRFSVLVMDDGSHPHVAEALRAWCEGHDWHLLRNDQRQGYTPTMNRGVQEAVAGGAEWVCGLNSDTVVTPGWLRRLVRAGESDPSIALVGPFGNNAVHMSLPVGTLEGEDPVSLNEKIVYVSRHHRPDAPTPTGFCLLIRRKAWQKHGPFRDDIYGEAYGEECEFWAQCVNDRMRAVLADDVYVWHQSHASYGKEHGAVVENRASNLFLQRHGVLFQPRAEEFRRVRDEKVRYVCARMPTGTISGRPKVCYLISHYGIYGGVFALVNLVNRLILMGWDARIACVDFERQALDALPLLSYPAAFGSHAALQNHFAEHVFGEGVLCATVWNTANEVAAIVKDNPGLKACYFVQDYESEFTHMDGSLFTAPKNVHDTYGLIDTKIVNSKWVQERMERENGAAGCQWIPVGVDTSLFHPRPRTDESPTVLLFYRPETPRRGPDMVEAVCRLLAEHVPEARVITYGGASKGFGPNVEQMGVIPQERAAFLYSQADVFVECSHSQGFGLQGLEAMASGCALISTRNRGIDNYGVDRQNCALVDPGDAESAVEAVRWLLQDKVTRAAMVKHGRETAREFDWWPIAEKHAAVYRGLLG